MKCSRNVGGGEEGEYTSWIFGVQKVCMLSLKAVRLQFKQTHQHTNSERHRDMESESERARERKVQQHPRKCVQNMMSSEGHKCERSRAGYAANETDLAPTCKFLAATAHTATRSYLRGTDCALSRWQHKGAPQSGRKSPERTELLDGWMREMEVQEFKETNKGNNNNNGISSSSVGKRRMNEWG